MAKSIEEITLVKRRYSKQSQLERFKQ